MVVWPEIVKTSAGEYAVKPCYERRWKVRIYDEEQAHVASKERRAEYEFLVEVANRMKNQGYNEEIIENRLLKGRKNRRG